MTRMTGPERAVMCNLINTHTHTHTHTHTLNKYTDPGILTSLQTVEAVVRT